MNNGNELVHKPEEVSGDVKSRRGRARVPRKDKLGCLTERAVRLRNDRTEVVVAMVGTRTDNITQSNCPV